MSRKPTDPKRLASVVLGRLVTWLRPRTVFLGPAGGDEEAAISAFEAWCAVHPGAACELALSSRWIVCCVPPAGAGEMTTRELRGYAQRQIAHYLDDSHGADESRWAMGVSSRSDAPIACAAAGELIDRLKRAAKAHRVSIRRAFPWWLGATSAEPDTTGSVVVAEPGLITSLHFSRGRLHRVETDFDADRPCPGAVVLWPGSDPMPVACDAAPVAAVIAGLSPRRSIDLDLLGTPPRAWKGSWALLLVAVVCALGEARREDGLSSTQAREQALLERVQASRARVRPTASAVLPTGGGAAADLRALEAAADMLALQQHPWADVFTGVEAASGNVALLSLQHDATRPVVDIELAVPNDGAAWGFAEHLSADSLRFRSATLSTRQPLSPAIGPLTGLARVQAVLASVPVDTGRGTP